MAIELKRLTENELELMMNWRMREDITKMMFTNVKLNLEGQKKWFTKIKNSTTEIRWIIYFDGIPVGSNYIVEIDRENQRCESGWFLAEKQGIDLKSILAIQQNTYDYVFNVLNLNKVCGFVMDINIGAVRLLEMCGIQKEGVLKQHIIKNGNYHDVYAMGLTKRDWLEKKKTSNYQIIHMI